MSTQRPVNLELSTIRFPITAIVSILHRLSGLVIFALLPVLLCALQASLASEESYAALQECMSSIWVKLTFWALLAALIYHLLAGVKHLLMDIGIGETLEGGKAFATATLILAAVLIFFAGGLLW